MTDSLWMLILLGLSLAIPIGPINIEMLKRGLRSGFLSAWMVGLGGMTADVVLMFCIFFGLAAFLTQPVMQLLLWCSGFFVLCYLGYASIRDGLRQTDQFSGTSTESLRQSFLSGFLIALSNPLNIIFWVSIYGSVLAIELTGSTRYEALLKSSGIFIGIILWDIAVCLAAHAGSKKVSFRWMNRLSIAAGIALIGFGLGFGAKAVELVMGSSS